MKLLRVAASNSSRVDTGRMRFRAILASLLTAMLLSLAPFAPQCEIKCDLASMDSGCHASSLEAHGNQQMAGMPDMKKKASFKFGDQIPTLVAIAPACHTHACVEQPAVLSERNVVVAHVSPSVEIVFFDSRQFHSEPAEAEFFSRGPPPSGPATPVSLRTTLLI